MGINVKPMFRVTNGTNLAGRAANNLSSENVIFLKDEFITGTNEAGEIGELQWNIGASGGTVTYLQSETGRPGIIRCATAATQFSQSRLLLGGLGTNQLLFNIDTFREMTVIARIVASDNRWDVGMFTGDISQTDFDNNSVFFRISGFQAAQLVTRAGGTTPNTVQRASTFVTPNAWIKVTLRRVGNGIAFYFNNELVGTSTTNIPSNVMVGVGSLLTTSVAAIRNIDLDFFSLTLHNTNR